MLSIKRNRVAPGGAVAVRERCDLLPEQVENTEPYITGCGQLKTNNCCRVERVWVVLLQRETHRSVLFLPYARYRRCVGNCEFRPDACVRVILTIEAFG